jgi:hypothetical protein
MIDVPTLLTFLPKIHLLKLLFVRVNFNEAIPIFSAKCWSFEKNAILENVRYIEGQRQSKQMVTLVVRTYFKIQIF